MDTLPKFALSIRQPWAWCIVNLGKDIENRNWPTRFRGPVCIHAAKGMTRDEYEGCLATVHAISRTHPFPQGGAFPEREELQRGGIVATAEIVNCVDRSASPWFFGTFGFVLRNVQPVEFIPVKGALGFFEWRKNLDDAGKAGA
ncbi:hypothetical protein GOZ80_06010 [Agrobacterium vitis]|nr:hypothetical protein [Agrobacterium vitis]MVB00521.1 hypothetical protein [Agrobacterium vitis]